MAASCVESLGPPETKNKLSVATCQLLTPKYVQKVNEYNNLKRKRSENSEVIGALALCA
jgi:hypothetical protein